MNKIKVTSNFCMNYGIQSEVSNLRTDLIIKEINEKFIKKRIQSRFKVQFQNEIIFEIKKKEEKEVCKIIENVFKRAYKNLK